MIDNTRNERHEQRRRIQQGKDHDRRVALAAHLKSGMPLSAADHAFLNGVAVPSPAQAKANEIIAQYGGGMGGGKSFKMAQLG